MLEEAAQHIQLQEGAKVADVPVVVDRGSANINAQRLAIRGLENFDSVGECVEEADGHPGLQGNYANDPHGRLLLTFQRSNVHRAVWWYPNRQYRYDSSRLTSGIDLPFQWRVKFSSVHRLTLRMRST